MSRGSNVYNSQNELAFRLVAFGAFGNEQVPHGTALSADPRDGSKTAAVEPSLRCLHHHQANNSRNRSRPC